MSQELIYTSAPRGLKPGTRGFCTVVSTQQMSQPLAERLESLSGYRHLFAHHDAQAGLNPVIHSHLILAIGGRKYHVLSRIADAGMDYTQRSNKFAHHVVLDATELPAGGPAWLLSQPGFMQTEWDGEPKVLSFGRHPLAGVDPPAVCHRWQELTGDAGWAGVLAETASGPVPRPACVFFRPGQELLPLVAEALSLLPQSQRWSVTFSTWFTKLPPGVDCQWRFLLADSPEAKQARRQPHALMIDLTETMPEAGAGALVEAARTGIVTSPAHRAAPPIVAPAVHRPGEQVIAAENEPPPLVSASEYSLGPPSLVDTSGTKLQSARPRKRRSKVAIALLVGAVAMLVLVTVGVAPIAVYLARTKRMTQTAAAQKPPRKLLTPATGSTAPALPKSGKVDSDDIIQETPEGDVDAPKGPASGAGTVDLADGQEPKNSPSHVEGEKPEIKGKESQSPPVPGQSSDSEVKSMPSETAAENPFAAMSDSLELPDVKRTSDQQLAALSRVDISAVDLGIVGWDELTGRSLRCSKNVLGTKAEWMMTDMPETGSTGLAKQIGVFSIEQDHLNFKWIRSREENSILRGCLLRLSFCHENRMQTAFAALCESQRLDRTPIDFHKSSAKIPLPIDVGARGASKPVRLEMRLSHAVTGNKVVLEPQNGVVAEKTKVLAKTVLARYPVVIEANVVMDDSTQQGISLSYRWKRQEVGQTNQLVEKDVALSISEIEKHRKSIENQNRNRSSRSVPRGWIDPLKQAEEKRDQDQAKLSEEEKDLDHARDELDQLNKKPRDSDHKEREKLEKEVANREKAVAACDADVKRSQKEVDRLNEYFSDEPKRCKELADILANLPKAIHLRIYYQFGQSDDKAMQVTLAETAQE